MKKVIRSMLYRATHDIFFYIAIGLCIIMSVLIVSSSAPGLKDHVKSAYDDSVIVEYETEDVHNVAKHVVVSTFDARNVPGHDIHYRDSLNNMIETETAVVYLSFMVLIFDILYGLIFFGELFSKGAIRNIVSAGINNQKVFIASIIVNVFIMIAFTFASALTFIIFIPIYGLYPLIYLPALFMLLIAELIVGTLAGALVILIIFITQRPLRSMLIVIGCIILVSIFINNVDYTQAFDCKYIPDSKALNDYIEDSKKHGADVEWYMPVDNFELFSIRVAGGKGSKEFYTDELNPDYSGDVPVAITRTLWRLNVACLPIEVLIFNLYPVYRDGILLRYIAVSSCYLVILTAAGYVIVKKKNIN